MVDYKQLLKILIEWSLVNKEYETAYFIYITFNIGIPVKLLYRLPNRNMFFSLESFITGNDTKHIHDVTLRKLCVKLKKSKYKKLKDWDGKYGYSLI